MYKREFQKINKTYKTHLYNGLLGRLMKKNHDLWKEIIRYLIKIQKF